MVKLLSVDYEQDYSRVQGIYERECSGNATISKASKLAPL